MSECEVCGAEHKNERFCSWGCHDEWQRMPEGEVVERVRGLWEELGRRPRLKDYEDYCGGTSTVYRHWGSWQECLDSVGPVDV